MNIARRLFSSSSRVASTATGSASTSSVPAPNFIHAEYLPPVIFRHIERALAQRSGTQLGGEVKVQNPFVDYWKRVYANDKKQWRWYGAGVSRRRQKQLLESYPGEMLPPSTVNPVEAPRPIKWVDGTMVSWTGKWKPKPEQSLYASRRLQPNGTYFKGHKSERDAPARQKDREERMAGMEKRVADWRKNKRETKVQGRSSLPF